MNHDAELKLQSFLDGELSEADAREAAKWLAQDQEAVMLLAELRNTRQALAGAERIVCLPETREFYWSKIERDIQRLEQTPPSPAKPSLLALLRRLLVPAGAVAALVIAVLVAGPQLGLPGVWGGPESEAAYADTSAFTYRDYAAQATLVWFSYPAENEIADGTPADTLPE